MRKTVVPDGWPCFLEECPNGPFIDLNYPDDLCFKSEYHHDDGRIMAYNSAGEFFRNVGNPTVQHVKMITERE